MKKHNALFYLRPLTWFAERWLVLSMIMVVSVGMFTIVGFLGILTSVFGLIYFIHRYIAWDWIEQYFDRE